MTYCEAVEIFEAINGARHTELKDALVQAAMRYARIRTDWQQTSPQARTEMDAVRRRAHDVFIDACNILSRDMSARGEDIKWRERLGRKREEIGDFACYLHCILGIGAR